MANIPGTKEHRANERAAQERYNVPKDKAGRDYISRVEDHKAYHDNLFELYGRNCIRCRNNKVKTRDDYFCEDCKAAEAAQEGESK